MTKQQNIFPIFDRSLQREDREQLMEQKAKVIWFTGLSGSGKSTLALELEKELHSRGILCYLLDGDNIRAGINSNLGFSDADRVENIRRIAEVSKLFVDCGVVTLASFVSPTNSIRKMASDIIGSDDFVEIFVSTPLEVCEQRDIKGLYKKARAGEIKDFTGISAPFEMPESPFFSIDTSKYSLNECTQMLLEVILPLVKKNS